MTEIQKHCFRAYFALSPGRAGQAAFCLPLACKSCQMYTTAQRHESVNIAASETFQIPTDSPKILVS